MLEELLSELALILALTLANGVFAGAEIALVSVRSTRLQERADEGSRAARTAGRCSSAQRSLLAP